MSLFHHPKVKEKSTGKIYYVEYGYYRGNKRLWVNGKFYSDKEFNKKFEFIKE